MQSGDVGMPSSRSADILKMMLCTPLQKAYHFGMEKENTSYTVQLNQICNDSACDSILVVTVYQKRWKVEKLNKSFKSNAGLAKVMDRSMAAMKNSSFKQFYVVFKREFLKIKHIANQFALLAKL